MSNKFLLNLYINEDDMILHIFSFVLAKKMNENNFSNILGVGCEIVPFMTFISKCLCLFKDLYLLLSVLGAGHVDQHVSMSTMCTHVCVPWGCMYVYHMHAGAHRGQK